MEKFLFPTHPVLCIVTGPSECGKLISNNLILKIINKLEKIYIFSTKLYQDFYQNLMKCFSNYILINVITFIVIEEHIDPALDEIVDD